MFIPLQTGRFKSAGLEGLHEHSVFVQEPAMGVFYNDVVFRMSLVYLKGIWRLRSDADVENEFSDGLPAESHSH
jgi:hypothetical protein